MRLGLVSVTMATLRTCGVRRLLWEGSMKRITAFRRDHSGSHIARISRKKFILMAVALAALIALPSAVAAFTPPTGTGVRLGGIFRDGAQRTILADTPFYVTQAFIVDDPNSGQCGGAGQPDCATSVDVQQSSISLTINGKRQN